MCCLWTGDLPGQKGNWFVFPPSLPSTLKDWEWGEERGSHPKQSCFALQLSIDPEDTQEGWKNLQFVLVALILGSASKDQCEFSSGAVAPSWHLSLQMQLFCSMEEVNFALGPAEWEGLPPHEAKQGQRIGFGFVLVISCSDPARLEEGVNLWGLTILRAGENYPPSPLPPSQSNKQGKDHNFVFLLHLATPWHRKIFHI